MALTPEKKAKIVARARTSRSVSAERFVNFLLQEELPSFKTPDLLAMVMEVTPGLEEFKCFFQGSCPGTPSWPFPDLLAQR